jgi:hypothetical protein
MWKAARHHRLPWRRPQHAHAGENYLARLENKGNLATLEV